MAGTLYLVATPIGNLQDMSARGVEVLRSVSIIAAEDTRHTLKLLNHFRISNKLVSYHEHNEMERAEEFVDRLLRGESIAVVSDAGMPGICDPAFRAVQRAIEVGVPVVPIPGAVAFVTAVVASGLATDSIFFGGFLPSKKSERRKRLEECRTVPATLVFYESPHRLAKSLIDCAEILGPRFAVAARELTKVHEDFARGKLDELAGRFSEQPVKGEIVLVIERMSEIATPISEGTTLRSRVDELIADGIDQKAALKKAAKEFGLSKQTAYKALLVDK